MSPWIGVVGLMVVLGALTVLGIGWAGGLHGQRPTDLGVHNGRLKAPSATRNSVGSQAWMYTGAGADYARIEPLAFEGSAADAMQRLSSIVASMRGARIIEARPDYLVAEFTTRWLRFVDDVEFAMLASPQRIDVRSASRLGREDFGVNRARIEAIRARFNAR